MLNTPFVILIIVLAVLLKTDILKYLIKVEKMQRLKLRLGGGSHGQKKD